MSGLQYSKYSQAQIVPNHILFKSHSKINLKLLKLSHLCTSETSDRNLRKKPPNETSETPETSETLQ